MSLSFTITPPGFVGGLPLRAWAVVNAAGTLVRGSNVASVNRTGAGAYTVNFSPALSDSNGVVDVRPLANLSNAVTVEFLGGLTAGTCAINTKISGTLNDHGFYVGVYQ